MWEGLSLPHDTKFGNSRCEIVGSRVIFIWSLIHGLRWSGLIKAEPGTVSSNKSVRWGIRSKAKVFFILWNKTMYYSRAPPKLGWGILRWNRLKIFEYWWGQLSNIKSWWPKLITLSVWKSFFSGTFVRLSINQVSASQTILATVLSLTWESAHLGRRSLYWDRTMTLAPEVLINKHVIALWRATFLHGFVGHILRQSWGVYVYIFTETDTIDIHPTIYKFRVHA